MIQLLYDSSLLVMIQVTTYKLVFENLYILNSIHSGLHNSKLPYFKIHIVWKKTPVSSLREVRCTCICSQYIQQHSAEAHHQEQQQHHPDCLNYPPHSPRASCLRPASFGIRPAARTHGQHPVQRTRLAHIIHWASEREQPVASVLSPHDTRIL